MSSWSNKRKRFVVQTKNEDRTKERQFNDSHLCKKSLSLSRAPGRSAACSAGTIAIGRSRQPACATAARDSKARSVVPHRILGDVVDTLESIKSKPTARTDRTVRQVIRHVNCCRAPRSPKNETRNESASATLGFLVMLKTRFVRDRLWAIGAPGRSRSGMGDLRPGSFELVLIYRGPRYAKEVRSRSVLGDRRPGSFAIG